MPLLFAEAGRVGGAACGLRPAWNTCIETGGWHRLRAIHHRRHEQEYEGGSRTCRSRCTTGCGLSRSRSRSPGSRNCGYDAIEISGEPERYDTKHVRKLLQDHGLTCWGSVTLMLADRDLLAKDEAQRAASVKYVRDCITMVKELGGQEITIVPSTVGKIKPQGTPERGVALGRGEPEAVLRRTARSEGVKLAIEPLNRFETYFLNRHDQALALAKDVGPECGVCIDVFHMNIEEKDMYQAIRNCKGRLVDFHVADNNRMACGMGHCDWGKIIGTLEGDRLRRRAHRGVRRPGRPHAGQPVPERASRRAR